MQITDCYENLKSALIKSAIQMKSVDLYCVLSSTGLALTADTQIHRNPSEFMPWLLPCHHNKPCGTKNSSLVARKTPTMPKPQWHAPWKLFRVISGHLGWVRSIAVEPGNQWFVTGAGDRTIKIWDLASGKLKLSLTGHISTVRGVAVSTRSPYLFSCGEDKQVKCWDLEYNKVIRHYHGHLSAVYDLDLHQTIDVLVTCSRDATARVWDIRSKANVHTLSGHTNTVATVRCQAAEPQIITGSHDSTIRLWDLIAGKTRATLTNHKKSVRALALHPRQYVTSSYVVNGDAYVAPKFVIFCYLVVVNDRVDRLAHFICAF
uniref:Pleiotropic regulator 1 n=1 Tax=Oncorhynchus mykiss TaxID=8022 RepID=A0A8K9UNB1_ONCMY